MHVSDIFTHNIRDIRIGCRRWPRWKVSHVVGLTGLSDIFMHGAVPKRKRWVGVDWGDSASATPRQALYTCGRSDRSAFLPCVFSHLTFFPLVFSPSYPESPQTGCLCFLAWLQLLLRALPCLLE